MDNKDIKLSSIHYKLSKAYENYNIGDYAETIMWCSDIFKAEKHTVVFSLAEMDFPEFYNFEN